MTTKATVHRFRSLPSGSPRKGRRGKLKHVRVGARNPGATKIGSIRHPF